MEWEDHEALLNELLQEDLDTSRKTEILNNLRSDYGEFLNKHQENTEKIDKLQAEKDDLVVSNSKLFRQQGIMQSDEETKFENEKKEFSETVNIDDIEKSAPQ